MSGQHSNSEYNAQLEHFNAVPRGDIFIGLDCNLGSQTISVCSLQNASCLTVQHMHSLQISEIRTMKQSKKRSDCPISLSLEVWGDKWTLLIIRDLMFENKRTYSDFLNSHESIATNILATRLKMLQDNEIIQTTPPLEGETNGGYALTQKGIDMLPIMMEVYFWSQKHYPIPKHVEEILKVASADKSAFIEKIQTHLLEKIES